MCNGKFPKLRGTICNIPIETPNVCKVLPRESDSNGIIYVELKRKLSRTLPVISQQIRCEKIQAVLNYLVTPNHLHKNINMVLPVVALQEINDENDFPIDFNSINLNKKHESAE